MFFHLSPGKCLVNVALMLHEERKDHPGEGKHEREAIENHSVAQKSYLE